jgi:hypothetical protein
MISRPFWYLNWGTSVCFREELMMELNRFMVILKGLVKMNVLAT